MLFAVAALLLGGGVAVDGGSRCPEPGAVAQRLPALLPRAASLVDPAARPDRATIEQRDGVLVVELRSAEGELLAERRLLADSSCADLAAAVAVVIASWQAELRPVDPASARIESAPPAGRRGVVWDVGLGLRGAFALPGGAFAPGGELAATVGGSRWRGFAIRLAATGDAPRALPLGDGRVNFSRFGIGLGGRLRLPAGRLRFDLQLAPVVALLRLEGAGFANDRAAFGVDALLTAGARVGVVLGRLLFSLGLDGAASLRRQTAVIELLDQQADLPRFDLVLGVAISFVGAGP